MSHYSPHDPSRSPPLVPLPPLDPPYTHSAPPPYPIQYDYDSPYDPTEQQYRPPQPYAPPPHHHHHYLYPPYAHHPAAAAAYFAQHPSPDYRPESPYDPATATAAYNQSSSSSSSRRRAASPSSPAARASPHFEGLDKDDDVARGRDGEEEREREREEIERQVGRREIEERERAAWSKQPVVVFAPPPPAPDRRPSSSSSPEYHQHHLLGFHTADHADGTAAAQDQDLDDLLRAVRGDSTPHRQQQPHAHILPSSSSSFSLSKSAASLPWQQQHQRTGERIVEEEEEGGGGGGECDLNGPSSPVLSSTLREPQQRGNVLDGYDPAAPRRGWSPPPRVPAPAPFTTAEEEARAAAADDSSSARVDVVASRPRKRSRVQSSSSDDSHSRRPRMDMINTEERPEPDQPTPAPAPTNTRAAAERACLLLPRRSVIDYARRHELAVDAEARIVEGEIVLGERRRDVRYRGDDDDNDGEGNGGRTATGSPDGEGSAAAAAAEEDDEAMSDGRERWTLFGERLHSLAPSTQVLMARAMRDITYPDRLRLYDHPAARNELERTVPWFVTLLTTIRDRYELAGASSIAPQDPPPPPPPPGDVDSDMMASSSAAQDLASAVAAVEETAADEDRTLE